MVSSRRGIAKRRVFRKLSVKSRVMRGRKLTKKSKSRKGSRGRRTKRQRGGYYQYNPNPGDAAAATPDVQPNAAGDPAAGNASRVSHGRAYGFGQKGIAGKTADELKITSVKAQALVKQVNDNRSVDTPDGHATNDKGGTLKYISANNDDNGL